ncbi:hypothetical protein J7L01_06680 [bacterium]|nr:hypothetical protein [bacterium]
MLIWALTIIILSVGLAVSSLIGLDPASQVVFAGAILLVSLTMMYKFVYAKPSDRENILKDQIDEMAKENQKLRQQ